MKGRSISLDIHRDVLDLAKESLVSGIGIRAIVNTSSCIPETAQPGELERLGDTANCHRILLKSFATTRKFQVKLNIV